MGTSIQILTHPDGSEASNSKSFSCEDGFLESIDPDPTGFSGEVGFRIDLSSESGLKSPKDPLHY